MEFIPEPYIPQETIAAISTPPGEGAVSIIRISGKNVIAIVKKIFSRNPDSFKSHRAYLGHILDENGCAVDEVLLMLMKGKKSYTGEDTAEIFCHGGSLITRQVLNCALKAGARQAKPGEFTLKAYMNGKLDLSQAEAVQELIHAKNEKMLKSAGKQLSGGLSDLIKKMQVRLNEIAAILEAWVDFPEEGIEFEPIETVIQDLENTLHEIKQLSNTYLAGKIIQEGLKIALIGAPNVGKSSLMNALLLKEKAIVSSIPGTTRDLLEDSMRLSGLNLILMDTAGIRNTDNIIEQEGIRRSKAAMNEADIIFLILDASRSLSSEEWEMIYSVPKEKTLVIWNKIDLASPQDPLPFEKIVNISALTRSGLDSLREKIDEHILNQGCSLSQEEIIITNVRHKESLDKAYEAFSLACTTLKTGVSPEFISFHMREGLSALGSILGGNITEDILTSIFNKFCIGK